MKMMHPLDLSVRVYGGFVWASRDVHLRKERNVRKRTTEGEGTRAEAYVGPWNFPDVGKLIISSNNDPISRSTFPLLFY